MNTEPKELVLCSYAMLARKFKEQGDRLREFREALHIEQKEMARRLKRGKAQYSNYENGHSFPPDFVFQMEEEFHVHRKWLVDGDEAWTPLEVRNERKRVSGLPGDNKRHPRRDDNHELG